MKKRWVKFFALLLAFSLGGCFSGTQEGQSSAPMQPDDVKAEGPPTVDTQPISELRLAYDFNDSLNPYQMSTNLNRELVPLLYDSLVRVDDSFRPENQLAKEVTMMPGATICIVKFNQNAQFSDGTRLTGEDLVYSLTTAASSPGWREQLLNVRGSTVNLDGNFEIHLQAPDFDFPALLNFPIIKQGQSKENFPTGISRYYVSGTWGNTGVTLSANPLYYGEESHIKTIRLVGSSDPDGLAFGLKTGEIDLFYEDSDEPDNGNNTLPVAASIPLNRLVYLGVNRQNRFLSNPIFRQAISSAVNRDELVSTAYLTRAVGSFYPFHPYFYRLDGMELSTPRNLSKAEALLEKMGMSEKNGQGLRLQNEKPVTLRLLVNSENTCRNAAATLIARQLGQVGIKVEVISQAFPQYQASIAAGNYDLYIGEVRLQNNLNFSALLAGGALEYYTPYSEQVQAQYAAYRQSGTGTVQLCEAFSEEVPFIPLVFRQGRVVSHREFRTEMIATEQNIFYNIEQW